MASSKCGFDAAQGYQSATNGGSCFIRDASNTPVVVDYTAFRYTTYSFTMQMLEFGQTPTRGSNISPHGGINICNTDGTNQVRAATTPELWFISRTHDFGYGSHGKSTAEMRSVSNGLWPDAPRVWEIVMEWDGASYKLVSWKVDGTAIPSIAGQISGCGADTSAAGQVRVWTWSRVDSTFKVKDFTVTQEGPSPGIVAFPANPAATNNPVASSNCGFDVAQGYQSATNGGSCFIRDASNAPVVVDYTAFRYTTYSFTIQMLENGQTPTKNNNISPHGGIKICNMDGTSQTRGNSPELWFIDRGGDFGYGLYNGGWGHTSTAEMRSVSEGLWPGAPRVWKIVMEWDGTSYKLVSWKVDGTAIPSIAG